MAAIPVVMKSVLSFRKFIFALKIKVSHANRGRSKANCQKFPEPGGRPTVVGCGERGEGWKREKMLDTASVFLQLSKYEETGSSLGDAIGGPLCSVGRRAAAGHFTIATFLASDRNDRGRSAGRTRNSGVDAFPSPGKIETSGI